jgi:hypothetical protein
MKVTVGGIPGLVPPGSLARVEVKGPNEVRAHLALTGGHFKSAELELTADEAREWHRQLGAAVASLDGRAAA